MKPEVIVIQYEARHRYAVPRLLYEAGFLSKLITGSHAESPLGSIVKLLSKSLSLPAVATRLSQRQIEGIPAEFVHSFDAWSWQEWRLKSLFKSDPARWLTTIDSISLSLNRNIDFTKTDVLYTMGGQNLSLLKRVKRYDTKVIVDTFISPVSWRQTFKSKCENGLKPSISEANFKYFEAHYKAVFENSDVILCPSQWVAEGVLELDAQFKPKIRLCPYGSSLNFSNINRSPVHGRIFWAGGDWFRKGLHILAAAADILKPKYPELDFRVAGITDPDVMSMSRFKNLNFLGKLDRFSMEHEFASADMFVFPTLSEGMASVILEAITIGCPVITTREAGIDAIKHGENGLIVESRNSKVLAREIELLFLNRRKLESISNECIKLAKHYTEDAWSSRLGNLVEYVLT